MLMLTCIGTCGHTPKTNTLAGFLSDRVHIEQMMDVWELYNDTLAFKTTVFSLDIGIEPFT